jgi:hypothetical protein
VLASNRIITEGFNSKSPHRFINERLNAIKARRHDTSPNAHPLKLSMVPLTEQSIWLFTTR